LLSFNRSVPHRARIVFATISPADFDVNGRYLGLGSEMDINYRDFMSISCSAWINNELFFHHLFNAEMQKLWNKIVSFKIVISENIGIRRILKKWLQGLCVQLDNSFTLSTYPAV
jgi:hypothetical protein